MKTKSHNITDDEIESHVDRLSKESTAPDKETPDWMKADIRRGILCGIGLMMRSPVSDTEREAVGAADKITRVEVIDSAGRSYVKWDDKIKVTLSFQDEGRTLKIFIKENP